MNEQKPISHLVAGLIIGALMIILSLVAEYLGFENSTGMYVCSLVIFIGGLVLFILLYGKSKHNQVGFGSLFAYGFKTTTFIILIFIAFTVVYVLLFPEYKEKAMEEARKQMAKRRDLTPSEIEDGVAMYRRMFWVYTIGYILITFAILGAIGSVIGAAVTKRKKPNPLDQLNL